MNDYQKYIALSRYARWDYDKKRRETWEEAVQRLINFWKDRHPEVENEVWDELYKEIHGLEVMPSMRSLMTAGEALAKDNVAGFNCAYTAINKPRKFDEIVYVLMCGTGVGFSVERQYINLLPEVPDELHATDSTVVVRDSKIGWASSYRELISMLYAGQIPKWNLSKVRPYGAPLKTFGGRASGPGPLEDLFKFTVSTFRNARGRRLTSIECHDIVCKVAQIVVVGGVRRSALLSLSNLSDDRMRVAKSGEWWYNNDQRALANNSACYTETPDIGIFMKEWISLYESKSGERGIFSRRACQKKAAENGRRDPDYDFGTNPCSEIILRSDEFCNLSEVVIRPGDTLSRLKAKVRVATILGTLQAGLTNFRYLSAEWRRNTEEEALLGVSLTGVMDHELFNKPSEELKDVLKILKEEAIQTNKQWAERLHINPAAAITCIKPSGTVSQLVDSASGIHSRYAPYYLRTVRADIKDPITSFLKGQGVYNEVDVTNQNNVVFYFPLAAPTGSVFRDDRSAIEQLEHWLLYYRHWCEHKPSITVFVKEDEWLKVGAWCYEHFDELSGVSFLPHNDYSSEHGHIYKQAPYQEITKEEYDKWIAAAPVLDWTKLVDYEQEDLTTSSKEYACTSGQCDIL
jgi:ribonucleoside-diphosphate reductase alpha chain